MHAANDNSASAMMPGSMPRLTSYSLWLLAGLYLALPSTLAIVLLMLAL
jgi:hypothetical protein